MIQLQLWTTLFAIFTATTRTSNVAAFSLNMLAAPPSVAHFKSNYEGATALKGLRAESRSSSNYYHHQQQQQQQPEQEEVAALYKHYFGSGEQANLVNELPLTREEQTGFAAATNGFVPTSILAAGSNTIKDYNSNNVYQNSHYNNYNSNHNNNNNNNNYANVYTVGSLQQNMSKYVDDVAADEIDYTINNRNYEHINGFTPLPTAAETEEIQLSTAQLHDDIGRNVIDLQHNTDNFNNHIYDNNNNNANQLYDQFNAYEQKMLHENNHKGSSTTFYKPTTIISDETVKINRLPNTQQQQQQQILVQTTTGVPLQKSEHEARNIIRHNAMSEAALANIPLARHVAVTKHVPMLIRHPPLLQPYNQSVAIEVPQTLISTQPRRLPIQIPVPKTVAVPDMRELRIPIEKLRPFPVERAIPYIVERRIPYRVERQIAVPYYYNYPIRVPVVNTVVHKLPHKQVAPKHAGSWSFKRILQHAPAHTIFGKF